MESIDEEENEEVSPLPVEQPIEQKKMSNANPPVRATRFLSIADPASQLPNPQALMKLRQIHDQAWQSDEIPDEILDQIPFQIEIIPDRPDDLDFDESSSAKASKKNQKSIPAPTVIHSGLSEQRRLQIIQEILQKLSKTNILDELRQANRIPFRLPETTPMQKKVADRMRELMGTETVMLNDPIFMKTLCQRLEEKHRKDMEKHYQRLASAAHRFDN